VDSNVGKLAKWLRIAGFDATFYKDIDDDRLVRLAIREERVLLTRDAGILERRVAMTGRLKAILVTNEHVKSQLHQVVTELGLAGKFSPFTRCAECNALLVSVEKQEVEGLVPPYVYRTRSQYMRCPTCRRVYWRGTHWEKMSKQLSELAGVV